MGQMTKIPSNQKYYVKKKRREWVGTHGTSLVARNLFRPFNFDPLSRGSQLLMDILTLKPICMPSPLSTQNTQK